MKRRPVARVTTGVAVATLALTSVLSGTAWAPKVHTMPVDPIDCRGEPGWRELGFTSPGWCHLSVRLSAAQARIEAMLAELEENGRL